MAADTRLAARTVVQTWLTGSLKTISMWQSIAITTDVRVKAGKQYGGLVEESDDSNGADL